MAACSIKFILLNADILFIERGDKKPDAAPK
jgi:hypothetical protein